MALAKKNFIKLKNPLLLAAIFSALIHLTIYVGVVMGQHFGWWKGQQLPAWLQKISESLVELPDPKKMSQQLRNEVPLVFIDVDPQLNVKEPPKETKFYGAANTTAA